MLQYLIPNSTMSVSEATPALDSRLGQNSNGTVLSAEQLAINRGHHLAIAAAVMYVFTLSVAICRFVSRLHAGQRKLDDALLALSLVSLPSVFVVDDLMIVH
jgi:hypothetical protein